jgi:predicted amidohydrolase YtcJ
VLQQADLIISGRVVHSFGPADGPARAVAIRGGDVVAVADSLEDLADLRGPATRVLVDPDLVVLPGFFDTHNHLSWTGADRPNVDVSGASDIGEIVSTLKRRAATTPVGQWVVGNRSWHESTIRERRLPTAKELDAVSAHHPVLVPRGGHVATANSLALRLAGITASTPDPPGGTVVRDGSGQPVGPLIEFPAMAPVLKVLPPRTDSQLVEDLQATCRDYASRGLVAVRDPGISRADWDRYRSLRRRDGLPLRVRALFMLEPSEGPQGNSDLLRRLDVKPGDGDDVLRASGVKLFSDGGVEGGWFTEPYANDPGYCGHGFYGPGDLQGLVEQALLAGWQVGTHAVGDAAVATVLDAYESVLARHPGARPGSLVIEHAFMADDDVRRRVVTAGMGVTIQHPLLYALAGNMLTHWGPQRTERVMPVAEWVRDGALLAAGSDCNVAPGDPLLSVWGLVTRGTKVAGVQGRRFGIDRATAFALYTYAGWQLMGEQELRGRVAPGYSADLVVFREDPLTVPLDDLPQLSPVLTLLGGRPVYDRDGLLSTT